MKIEWDKVGERFFETGVDHGVLYQPDVVGEYMDGTGWNGLTAVNESPSGAEANPQYADNIKYLNLLSVEESAFTIEAFSYPLAFEQNDGSASPVPGVLLTQQRRKPFGFSYRSLIGNDVEGQDLGYKIHLCYGCLAAPSEKARNTINESPEATPFSWEVSTTPVAVGTIGGIAYKPTAHLIIDSTKTDPVKLAALEDILYGTANEDPMMPLPADVIALVGTTLVEAALVAPSYNSATKTITFPVITGVNFYVGGVLQDDPLVITEDTVVRAYPVTGYKFPTPHVDEWLYEF
jgi:hypothetical protein